MKSQGVLKPPANINPQRQKIWLPIYSIFLVIFS